MDFIADTDSIVFIDLYRFAQALLLEVGVEILFNAANLCFISLSTQTSGFVDPFAHSVVMMAIVLDGTVIAVGLAMVMNVYRHYKTIDIRKLRRLKW